MATKKAREAIANLLHDSGVWDASRMHISTEQDVFAAEIDGADKTRKRVAAVAEMIDDELQAKGEWALYQSLAEAAEQQAAGENPGIEPKTQELFEQIVLRRLGELEKATGAVGGSVRHLTNQVARRQSISVNIPDARLKDITVKAADAVNAQHIEHRKRVDGAARYTLICAVVCLVLVVAAIVGSLLAYNRGYDVGRSVSRDEIAAASWANTPQGKAAHDVLANLSEPTKQLLIYCNSHNWEGGQQSCFESARRTGEKTINVPVAPAP